MSDWVYAPPPGALPVLYEDRDLLAVDKPAGLLSVPGRDEALADCAEARLRRDRPGAQGVLVAVHRLDMDTSGVLLFALRRKAEAALKAQFRERRVTKVYRARVQGTLRRDAGVIDLPLLHAGTWPPTSQVDEAGRPARTRFEVLRREADTTLLCLTPETGRSHQLRVHLEAIGHPILGDRLYGTLESRSASDRLLLHALRLEVTQPWSGAPVVIEAPLPLDLA